MSDQDNQADVVKDDLIPLPENQFYGLDYESGIVVLPKAEYANQAYRQYVAECEEKNEPVKDFIMIFNEHQYRVLHSQIDAELNDEDGDTLIPTYFVISFATFLAVFPHPSVDTKEEIDEFVKGYPIEIAGPYKLADVKANWPAVNDPQTVSLVEQTNS